MTEVKCVACGAVTEGPMGSGDGRRLLRCDHPTVTGAGSGSGVNEGRLVAAEATRFGIETPMLIDGDARVWGEYGMVGVYGHRNRPSHSFALVRQDATIGWVRHYAEMFVPADALLAELDAWVES